MESSSVGHAYSVLKGYRFGDPEKAYDFLEGLSPEERTLRNRMESRSRKRARKNYKLGQRKIRR